MRESKKIGGEAFKAPPPPPDRIGLMVLYKQTTDIEIKSLLL